MSMQMIADQMIDAFLAGQIKLKRQVYVPDEMAAALNDPVMLASLLGRIQNLPCRAFGALEPEADFTVQ